MVEATCSSETSLEFTRLHDVAAQKTELFITTAVRTSDPAPVDVLVSAVWVL
jgi:hypothetical protein